MEMRDERDLYEVFAWGYGFVGARPSLVEAGRLAQEYEGARIITYRDGAFRVVSELGRYLTARTTGGDR